MKAKKARGKPGRRGGSTRAGVGLIRIDHLTLSHLFADTTIIQAGLLLGEGISRIELFS